MVKFFISLKILIFLTLTSCGVEELSVEAIGNKKLKANRLVQSISESIGVCIFASQDDPAYKDPLEFKIQFINKIKSGTLTTANISNIGTGGAVAITWNIINCGDDKNFKLVATGISGDGSIIPVVDFTGIEFAVGLGSRELDGSDNSVTYMTPAPFTWMGTADNNWSNNANWQGWVKPGVADTAIFNNACGENTCIVNMDENINIAGVNIRPDFAGSITQATGQSATIGESGFNQEAGFYITGANTFSVSGDFTLLSAGTFNAAGSLVEFSGTTTTNHMIQTSNTVFNNIGFTFGQSTGPVDKTIIGTLYISNNLILNTDANAHFDSLMGGSIDVKGDINIVHSDNIAGTTDIILTGSSDQTIIQTDGDLPGNILVNKASGKVLLGANYASTRIGQDIHLMAGTFDMAGNNLTVNNDLILDILPTQTIFHKSCGTLVVGGVTTDPGSGVNGTTSNPNTIVSDAVVTEGGSLEFNVSLSEAVCGVNFTLSFTTSDGTATTGNTDYTDNDSTLTITPGMTSGTITVLTTVDTNLEADENLVVSINTASHGTITDSNATGVILNDDTGAFMWSGLSAGDDWSTAGNWFGGVAPGVGDIAYFDGACTNCNVVVDTNVDVLGIAINSSYAGTITQASGNTFTVGLGDWFQAGGIFTGGDANIFINGDYYQSGGVFTATSATTEIGRSVSSSNTQGMIKTGGSFNHNNGALKWKWGTSSSNWSMKSATINTGTGLVLNDLIVSASAHVNQRGAIHQASTNIITVDGDLTFASNSAALMSGRIDTLGNISGSGGYGTSTVRIAGSTDQTIASGTRMPGSFEFASTGGTVFLNGTINIANDLTYISGNIDTGTSHVRIDHGWISTRACGDCSNIDMAPIEFYNFSIDTGTTSDYGTTTLISELVVKNNLILGGTQGSSKKLNGADLILRGNATLGDIDFAGGSATLVIAGSNNQTISNNDSYTNDANNDSLYPHINIASTGGTVSFVGDIGVGGNFTYTSGNVDLTASHIFFTEHRYGPQINSNINAPTLSFNNVSFRKRSSDISITTGLNIDGNLYHNHSNGAGPVVSGAGVTIAGDYIITNSGNGGSFPIQFDGVLDQSILYTTGTMPAGNVTVSKASGKVIQASNLNFSNAGQDLHLVNGDWDMAGFDLNITDSLELDAGTTLLENCGALTQGTLTNNGTIQSSGSNPNISINDVSSVEGNNLVFTVTLSEAICVTPFSVDFASSNGSASLADGDYTQNSGTVSIAAKTLTGTLTIATINDAIAEADETININLTNESTGNISDSLGVGTITNDDGVLAATIYRSTGFGNTTALSLGTDNAGTDLTITASIAVFEHVQPNNIGLGDAIEFDSTGDSVVDSIIFISGRISGTQFNVQTNTGADVPNLGSPDTNWSIFRAYTSLANAETGVENTGINPALINFDSWSGGHDLVTNNLTWNIVFYADAVDTSKTEFSGWTTSKQNQLNVLAPYLASHVGESQRHQGKWDNFKATVAYPGVGGISDDGIRISTSYFTIDGLQIEVAFAANREGIYTNPSITYGDSRVVIKNNIIRAVDPIVVTDVSGIHAAGGKSFIINNIVYGFAGAGNQGLNANTSITSYFYNNTVLDCNTGILKDSGNASVLKNNIVQNSTDAYFGDTIAAASTNNLSDQADAPGINPQNSVSVKFQDINAYDFRVQSTDSIAKNNGVNLSEDIFFDGEKDNMAHTRGTDGSWDIGAHEAATQLFRSVANGSLTSLQVGTGNNLAINSGSVTFTSGVANNIGVGDAIQYDRSGDGTVDSIMFIHARTNATIFTVRTANGSIPADLVSDDDWDIFRAYSSLANANHPSENTGLHSSVQNFNDSRDLVANNYQMMYPLYADAPFPAAGTFFSSNWTRDPSANINLYAPSKTSEVGTSQRHNGIWSTSFVHFTDSGTLLWPTDYMTIAGVQLFLDNDTVGGNQYGVRSSANFNLKDSIIRGPDNNTSTSFIAGLYNGDVNIQGNIQKIVNNIFYNWKNNSGVSCGIRTFATDINVIVYNNTFVDNERPFSSNHIGVYLNNNISQDITNGFLGTYHASSSNNLSSDTNAPGAGSVISSTLVFNNKAGDDFSLAAGDTDAQSKAFNLSNDSLYSFNQDIILQSRPNGDWDIGAFQF